MANLHKSKATPPLPGRLLLVIFGHEAGCLRGLGPAPDNPERAERTDGQGPRQKTAPRHVPHHMALRAQTIVWLLSSCTKTVQAVRFL